MVTRKQYPLELKAKVVRACQDNSASEVAKQFKIHPRLVWAWKRQVGGPQRGAVSKRGAYGLLTFALNELASNRPNLEVARAYIILARHELLSEAD